MPFLALPPELRNRIYALVLEDSCERVVCISWQNAIKHQPGIINTCVQTREETLEWYYDMRKPIMVATVARLARFEAFIKATLKAFFLDRIESVRFAIPCGHEPRRWPLIASLPRHYNLVHISLKRDTDRTRDTVKVAHGRFYHQQLYAQACSCVPDSATPELTPYRSCFRAATSKTHFQFGSCHDPVNNVGAPNLPSFMEWGAKGPEVCSRSDLTGLITRLHMVDNKWQASGCPVGRTELLHAIGMVTGTVERAEIAEAGRYKQLARLAGQEVALNRKMELRTRRRVEWNRNERERSMSGSTPSNTGPPEHDSGLGNP